MKIFLTWTSAEPEIINSLLEKQSNKIVYWIGGHGDEKHVPAGTVFHNMFDATRGISPEGVDISEFSPPGKDLIERLYKVESLILIMMNRRTGKLGINERKHLYYNLLQYWYGVLQKYAPDIIINQSIPHDICSYLVYELAHLLNIKTLVLQETGVSDRLLTYNDFWKGSDDLHKELQKNQGKNFSLKDLSQDVREYYKTQANPEYNAVPTDIILLKNRFAGFNLFLRRLKRLKNSLKKGIGSVLSVMIQSIIRRLGQNLKKEYESVQAKFDLKKPDFLNKKFVYMPLHNQPECSTCPLGDMFVEQILVIKTLSASLPLNWIIYVKEHPIQWIRRGLLFSNDRYRGYYKKIAKLKNVQLVPMKISGDTLVNGSQTVDVISGRTGWQATLKSKPAMIFGYPWYKDCSEIFRIKDVESCKEAIKKITSGFTVSQQKIINYLKCLDNTTIHGYLDPNLEKNSQLTKQENMNNVVQKILLEMKRK